MTKHSDAFKQFLLEDQLFDFPAQYKEFEEITQKGIIKNSNFISQEISKYSHLSSSEYDKKLQQLLDYPNDAIFTPHKITGIEDKESIVYIQNLSPDRLKLVSYQTLDRKEHRVDSLLFSGEISILGKINNSLIPMSIHPQFYGFMDNNRFVRLGEENRIMMAQNMADASYAFLEQLNLMTRKGSKDEIIRMN